MAAVTLMLVAHTIGHEQLLAAARQAWCVHLAIAARRIELDDAVQVKLALLSERARRRRDELAGYLGE